MSARSFPPFSQEKVGTMFFQNMEEKACRTPSLTKEWGKRSWAPSSLLPFRWILRSQGFIVPGMASFFPGGLVLASLSPTHWGGVLGSFQQYGGLPSFLSEDTMGPEIAGGWLLPHKAPSIDRVSRTLPA